jgi:hypothetical protein
LNVICVDFWMILAQVYISIFNYVQRSTAPAVE